MSTLSHPEIPPIASKILQNLDDRVVQYGSYKIRTVIVFDAAACVRRKFPVIGALSILHNPGIIVINAAGVLLIYVIIYMPSCRDWVGGSAYIYCLLV